MLALLPSTYRYYFAAKAGKLAGYQQSTLNMAYLKNDTLIVIGDFIQLTARQLSHSLDADTVNTIEHYLNHAEYEMAFEILFIELMKLNYVPPLDLDKSREIAIQLGLKERTVFDSSFWQKFDSYTSK